MFDSCNPMDCSLPGSSILRILQTRILEWVSISFSGGSSWPRNQTQVSCLSGRLFWATRENLLSLVICRASLSKHFAFMYFFFFGTVLVTASCTMLQISGRSSSGILFTRPNPLNLFITSTVWYNHKGLEPDMERLTGSKLGKKFIQQGCFILSPCLFNLYTELLLLLLSLQSCPTLCNPRDGSPPGSPVPGILQARTLEWVSISSSNAWKWSHPVMSDS